MVLRYFPTAESLPSCAILLQAARRTPTVHLHERLYVCAYANIRGLAPPCWFRDENAADREGGGKNERTGEARISPCKANLFACIETEYRLKPSVTT